MEGLLDSQGVVGERVVGMRGSGAGESDQFAKSSTAAASEPVAEGRQQDQCGEQQAGAVKIMEICGPAVRGKRVDGCVDLLGGRNIGKRLARVMDKRGQPRAQQDGAACVEPDF